MDATRLGAAIRAVRLRHRWRQVDVAARASVSQPTVSRIERGRIGPLTVGCVARVAEALDIGLDWTARWRGGELDRMLNAGHAAMHEALARAMARHGWTLAPEVSFSVYGERGVVDALCFHPATGALLVVELKTTLVDVQGLIGAADRYRRLAPVMARQRGWSAGQVSCWVALRDRPANHRRLAAHATVLRAAFPDDGRRLRGWLQRPVGPVSALSFLSDMPGGNGIAASTGVQRVRSSRASVQVTRNPVAHSPGASPGGSERREPG